MTKPPDRGPDEELRILQGYEGQETLLDLSAGVASTPHGETLLSLDASQGHASAIGRLAHITGTSLTDGVELEAASAPSNQTTAAHANSREKSFTERLRAPAMPQSRYEPRSELGRGGMGVVLRVRDTDLRRDVAMKVLRPDRTDGHSERSQRELRRFIEEAQVTGQLEHPGIVPVHELGCDAQGRVFFTMKMVKGVPLSEVVRRLRAGDRQALAEYPLDRMLAVFLKICEALSFAHAHQVVHRDLKPANVMLGAFGEVLVMDWGLSRVLSRPADAVPSSVETDSTERRAAGESSPEFTLDGTVVGTPAYMAPEQARGQLARIDARTDVFALGAMLYEFLCLRPPYEGSDATQLIASAAEGRIIEPLTRAAKDPTIRYRLAHLPGGRIPAELAAVAMKALSVDPADRYASVRDMQRDVENFVAGRPVSVRREPLAVRAAKWVRRHPTLAASASAAFAIVLVAATVLGWVLADASMREAESRQTLLEAERRARAESDKGMQAELERERSEKKAMAAFEEKARVEQQAKEAAMAREKALLQRARATQLYNRGRDHAARARSIRERELRANAFSLAESSFSEALKEDPEFPEASFELALLYQWFEDARAAGLFVQAHESQTRQGGKGDARALVYAADVKRIIEGDVMAAARLYEQAATVDPESPYAVVGLGFVALLGDRLDTALLLAGRAQNMDRTLWEPWYLEGSVYARRMKENGREPNLLHDPKLAVRALTEGLLRHQSSGLLYNERGTAHLAAGDIDSAEQDLNRARELMPWNYGPPSNLVTIHYRRGQYAEGCVLAYETLKEHPKAFELWNEYGNCLYALGQYAEALDAYEQCLALKKDRIAPLCNASRAARRAQDPKKAHAYALRATELRPDDALSWISLGLAQRELGEHEKALASLRTGFDLHRSEPNYAFEYFNQLAYLRKFKQTEEETAAYIREFPEEATGYHWHGRSLALQNRHAEAVKSLGQAAALSPQWDEPFDHLCSAHFNLQQVDEVAVLAAERLKLKPDSAIALYYLGATLQLKGDDAAALEAWLKAFAADAGFGRGASHATRAAVKLKRWADAKLCALRYIEHAPKDANAQFFLGTAEEGLDQYAEAAKAYERANELVPDNATITGALDRMRRLLRAEAFRTENRQPGGAAECYDLAFAEAYKGRWRHAAAWGRKARQDFGDAALDLQAAYFYAVYELRALEALKQGVAEDAPKSPTAPPLETRLEQHKLTCIALLRLALQRGLSVKELKADSQFAPLHEMEQWKALLVEFE